MPRPAAAESNVLDDCLSEAGDTALAACSAAIKANPNDAEAFQGRGSAYVRRGENERAMADYNTAIKISPEFGLPYFNRGLSPGKQESVEGGAVRFQTGGRT